MADKQTKICFITGTRADYGLMQHTLKEIKKSFNLEILALGMHLSEEFGSTVEQIKKDGFTVAERPSLHQKDTGYGMAISLSNYTKIIANFLKETNPDLVLLLGDRAEELAGAMVAAHMNIPVAHIHGGDQGDDGAHIDDSVRHAISKFAHLHLAATAKSAERLINMGEEKWRVYTTGSPAAVEIIQETLLSKSQIDQEFHLDSNKALLLVIQHSILTQEDQAREQMKITLEALADLNQQTILIYPNADSGGRAMIEEINQFKEKHSFLKTFKSLPRKKYLSLMKRASAMVGNSSSGSIDSAYFKLPVVNIGMREIVREHAGNKIFVGHNKQKIIDATKKALFDKKFIAKVEKCKSPYGDGTADKNIAKVLQEWLPLTNLKKKKLLVKRLSY